MRNFLNLVKNDKSKVFQHGELRFCVHLAILQQHLAVIAAGSALNTVALGHDFLSAASYEN